MNLNPVIIQRKNLRLKLWDDVRPINDEQVKAELIYMKYGFFDESGFNLPIEPDTTPKLPCHLCKIRINGIFLLVLSKKSAIFARRM
mgnify:FL=1